MKFWAHSGVLTMAAICFCSLSDDGARCFRRRQIAVPGQRIEAGTPDSAMVGRSGRLPSVWTPPLAISRRRPAFQCGMVVKHVRKRDLDFVADLRRHVEADTLVRMCVILMPAIEGEQFG